MTWRETYDTVLRYFRSKGDKEAEAKARSKPMQYYEDITWRTKSLMNLRQNNT